MAYNFKKMELLYSVQSTTKSAFADPFNWCMLGAVGLVVLASMLYCIIVFSGGALIIFCASVWFLFRYIKAIMNREITIDDEGVRYREAFRKLSFAWDEIEAIKLEPEWGKLRSGSMES